MMSNGGRTDDIWFLDENTGWAVNSNGQIVATQDGGVTWIEQAKIDRAYLRCISFSSPSKGWVGTVTAGKRLLSTNDRGRTWAEVKNLPPHPSAICGLCAVSDQVIYAAGTNWPNRPTGLLKSVDGGATWSLIEMHDHASLLVDVYFPEPDRGWVVGGQGGDSRDKVKPVVLYTEDGGVTWTNQVGGQSGNLPFGEWGWKIQFLNRQIGFVSLENFDQGAILRTDDGGRNWVRLPINDAQGNANLEGIGFVDERLGWVGGWGARDFKGGYSSETGDGGRNWKNANHIGKYLNRFRFIGNPVHTGYASGDTVYKYSAATDTVRISAVASPAGGGMVRNQDSEVHANEVTLLVDVPANSRRFEIDVWDRFGAHVATIHSEKTPERGPRAIKWEFPPNESGLSEAHYIYRVTVDEQVESRVVIHSRQATGNAIAASLAMLLADAKDGDAPPLPTVEQEKEALFRTANIEIFPEFRATAEKLARVYLAHADYNAWQLYNQFEYSDAAFDERMKQIYEAALEDMHKPYRFDRDVITWRNGKRYRVGRASDAVVKDQLLQLSPFNLMDGVWLQNIFQARPSDEVQSRLFDIWADEAGNGETRENHSNVYRDLLNSLGIYLPDVTSRRFIELDLADGAWRSPVFQSCIGLFPERFFPELLGMTLFLEWEATPSLNPKVVMLRGRGMNPLFYSLHVAIDNISEGHGALAKDAIKIFLEQKREQGGETSVQENWRRIWNGYVGWATAGSNGQGMEERRLIIDRISINLGTPENPQCFPDWKAFYRDRMIELLKRKAPHAKQVHGQATMGGVLLNKLFETPELLLEKLVASGTVDVKNPRKSRLFELMAFEGPMYRVFTEAEKNTILDWLESLAGERQRCLDPLPDTPAPQPLPEQVVGLVAEFAGRARRAHDQLTLPDASGQPKPFIEFLDDPRALMAAMVRGGWIVPEYPERSMFLTRILLNGGPMDGVFNSAQIELLTKWIEAGAEIPPGARPMMVVPSAAPRIEYSTFRAFIGQGAVH